MIATPIEERFWQYVRKTRGCWIWTGARDLGGYGVIWFNATRRAYKAHRLSYEMHVGEIRAGLFICHRCDTPACVNPAHLFAGTAKDNAIDSSHKGRRANQTITHCKRGHKYTEVTTYRRRAGNGQRECKTCASEGHRKWVAASGGQAARNEYMRKWRAARKARA